MPQTPFAPSVAPQSGNRAASTGGRPLDPTRALLTIAEHRVGRRAVLSVAGEVDISTAADLRTAIEAAGTRAFEVWVDANIRLTLICADGPVLRVIMLTGFDRIFEIHPSRSDANHAASA